MAERLTRETRMDELKPVAWAVEHEGFLNHNIFCDIGNAERCLAKLNFEHPDERRAIAPLYRRALPAKDAPGMMKEPRWIFTCLRPQHLDVYDAHVLKDDYDLLRAHTEELARENERLIALHKGLMAEADRRLEQAERRLREARPAEGWVMVPRAQLEHWSEYWNGNHNEKAMADALDHILREIAALLADPRSEPKEGE